MTEKTDTRTEPGAQTMDWAKMMADFWNPVAKTWGNLFTPQAQEGPSASQGRMSESMQATAKMWQTLMGAMSEPAAMENFQKASQLAPDIALGFSQTLIQGFIKFQTRVNEWVVKHGADTADFDAQSFDHELLELWTSLYENELSQFLKIPQIGLGRVYQERVMHATDELNRFQATFSRFMHLVYLPMESSFKTMQEKMAEMAEAGPLDDKSKTYYNLWIKVLEGHYMEMFKSEDFTDSLGETLSGLNTFVEARRAVINDVLKSYSIPTNNDLDDLYKEIYLLKKRIRACEKQ